MICTINTQPFSDQKPGTSGLRKKVAHVKQSNYLENFIQAIFNLLSVEEKKLLVVGGDGRFYNDKAIQLVIKIAAANGVKKLLVGKDGILSTPAASNLIRQSGAGGGIILSASHNPAGPNGDFGIKFNNASGSPAPESFTDALFQQASQLTEYRKIEESDVNLAEEAEYSVAGMTVNVIDSVAGYSELMSQLFDFNWLREQIASKKLSLIFDAMHAVTGPYAKAIFVDRLGAGMDSIMNGVPLDDFGGGHPDPNLVHAKALIQRMEENDGALLGAASDGDGDRNLILGRGGIKDGGNGIGNGQ